MFDYNQYVENSIRKLLDKADVEINSNFDSSALKEELKEEIEPIFKKFKVKLQKMSKELLQPLDVKVKINNLITGQEVEHNIIILDNIKKDGSFYFEKIEGLEKIDGVSWDVEQQKLVGKATSIGDFKLVAYGTFNTSDYQQKIESPFRLTIIPDPRSLWKNIEPNETLPYPKTHEKSNSLITEDSLRLLFASKRGRSHAHNGTFRDDDGCVVSTPSGWSILCVADGAGSCSLSREGSRIATKTATDILIELLSSSRGEELVNTILNNINEPSLELQKKIQKKVELIMNSSAYQALKDIYKKSEEINQPVKEFSTTLLLTAHKRLEQGHLIISFWIGDGVIAIYNKNRTIKILGEPDSGEFAGQTRFLSHDIFQNQEELSQRISINFIEDFTAIILATDGISDPFFQTDEDLNKLEKWDELYKELSEIVGQEDIDIAEKKLLEWLDFWSIGNHDDRTVALLLPNKPTSKEDSNVE